MTHTAGSTRAKLVVIGNGMAAGRVLDELFARAPDRFDVTMFGAEPRVNYDRIMLSPVLAGEKQFDDIIVRRHPAQLELGFHRQLCGCLYGRRHDGGGLDLRLFEPAR
jgi:hypothetical protein